eukprot:scaffold261_cov336-Pavlova_lutheri.AAC.57
MISNTQLIGARARAYQAIDVYIYNLARLQTTRTLCIDSELMGRKSIRVGLETSMASPPLRTSVGSG